MAKESIQSLILKEVQGLRAEITDVRTKDIPAIQTSVASFKEKLKAVESRQTWFSSIATVIGGVLAYTASALTGHRG